MDVSFPRSVLCTSWATVFLLFSISIGSTEGAKAGTVEIRNNQLLVDEVPQPQLFGAELQYFRLRGGQGRNIPRETVVALWNQALDRMVEARMNAVSFYIPWDFHEYADGKFDFTGTADEDGDGNADYPSRDVVTFFRLIKEHGIKHIMARPGPYINAEWGFLGFGAVPLWFHEKFPNSHARNSKGQRTTLYSYVDPDFLAHSRRWLSTVYREVLRDQIGPGRPVSFLQIDNETNLMWQSVYNHDYGARAIARYRDFLKDRYANLAHVNAAHARNWKNWDEVEAPVQPGQNVVEDQDWYRFQDFLMYSYLKGIRGIWESLGVREPQVLFTLAESYNAPEHGVLPNYKWRNSPDVGMMTVNLYPKTYETPDQTLLNLPFKADHDVIAADAASDLYLGRREEWVLGPEIQGGWWKGTNVSEASRRQTYLTTIGHGLKALFIYYFTEGDNWQYDAMKKLIAPYFERLKATPAYQATSEESLPDSFWRELDALVADQLFVADTRWFWRNGGTQPATLYFDAPLGPDAKPRAPFALIKEIGEKIVARHGDFLAKATALKDPVCVIKDSEAHAPSLIKGINSRVVQSDWSGGLVALLMHAGINPRIHHWNLNPTADLLDKTRCQLVVYQDTGFASPELTATLSQVIDRGGSVLSFLHTGLADAIRNGAPGGQCAPISAKPMEVNGYHCKLGIGSLYQMRVPIYDVFNTDFYHQIHDANERRGVIDTVLRQARIHPQVKIVGGGDRTVAFTRTSHDRSELWITVKTAKRDGFSGRIKWTGADATRTYQVTNMLSEVSNEIAGAELSNEGFPVELGASGSTAYHVRVLPGSKPVPGNGISFSEWLKTQERASIDGMLANISPPGTAPGTVIASPTRQSPNYYFHWVRDAALTMDTVVDGFASAHGAEKAVYLKHIQDFIALSRRQQLEPSAEGLGEPRYQVDGSADTIDWARPQYDGPALRALVLLRFIEAYPAARSDKTTVDVIGTDLEFIAKVWSQPSFDLWEELRGLHFYTQAVQYAALREGSVFYSSLGDEALALQFGREADAIDTGLEKYWDMKRGYIGASRDLERRPNEPNYKDENLDTAVILAALHVGKTRPKILSLTGDRLLATAEALERAFAGEYRINRGKTSIAIGRFTDDVYFGGNPWYMTTAAFAELYYRIAQAVATEGEIEVTKNNLGFLRQLLGPDVMPGQRVSTRAPLGQALLAKLRSKGDGFLEVVRQYAGDRGELGEQFDRDSGVPVSVDRLTWSYAGLLKAGFERAR